MIKKRLLFLLFVMCSFFFLPSVWANPFAKNAPVYDMKAIKQGTLTIGGLAMLVGGIFLMNKSSSGFFDKLLSVTSGLALIASGVFVIAVPEELIELVECYLCEQKLT